MRKLNLLYTLLISSSLFAQNSVQKPTEKTDLLNAYQYAWDWMSKTENYSFHLKYLSFTDHSSKQAVETSKGYYTKSGSNYMCNVMGIKTIQNKRMRVSVDSVEKLIILTNPEKLELIGLDMDRLNVLLDKSKKVTKHIESNSTIFKIEFEPNELYDSYEFKLNAKGLPEQMTFFYSERTDKEYDDKQEGKQIKLKPRLEIYFDDYKQSIKTSDRDYSETLYVSVDNTVVKKTEKYKQYALKDYRIKK